jgi:hypothetical protein
MAHLVCTDHKLRVLVLSDGTAVHRRNGSREKCETKTVDINKTRHFVGGVSTFPSNENVRNGFINSRFLEPVDELLLDADEIRTQREADDQAYREHAKLLSNYDKMCSCGALNCVKRGTANLHV